MLLDVLGQVVTKVLVCVSYLFLVGLHASYADLTQRQTGHANCFEQQSNSKLWESSLERLGKGEARRGVP